MGMAQQVAEILPDQVIELGRGAVARLTALVGLRIKGLKRTPAPVVALAMIRGMGDTGRLTDATAHQRP